MSWRLQIGCYSGSLANRDSSIEATVSINSKGKPLGSIKDCAGAARDFENRYASSGYHLWYAHAIAPDGTMHHNIIPGTSYR